jgi:hypothetical protein
MALSNTSASNRAIVLAAAAIVSAFLSNSAWRDGILWTPRLALWNVPLLPGMFFGTVLALGIWLWVSRSVLKIFAVVLSTVVAWVAAKITAEGAYWSIQQMLIEIAAPGSLFPKINFMFAVCGVIGGLVGSTTLAFALSLVCKEFGVFENWARIVMPGTGLGILLEFMQGDDKLAIHVGSLLPLFLAWQMTLAAVIGYCIVPRTGDGKLAPH